MGKLINETGNKYGSLIVVKQGISDSKGAYWICKCLLCGNTKPVRACNLRNGSTKNCGCKSLGYEIGKLGRQRINTVNDNFFSNKTLVSNYWAGFIAADGNLSKNRPVCSVTLALKDAEHLEQFVKDLNSSYTVKRKTDKPFPYATLYVTSKKLVEDLNKNFNITSAKSLTLTYPKFDDKLKEDAFITGYIDGDGYIQQSKRPRIEILGTEKFLEGINLRFSELLNKEKFTVKIKRKSNIYSLLVQGTNAKTLFAHFSKIDVPKLKRKWEDKDKLYD